MALAATRPVILVGRRPDGGWRDRIWSYVAARWTRTLGWPIHVGLDLGDRPFSLAHASNDAAARAGDWTLALYVGADVVLADAQQVLDAAHRAEEGRQLVFAHDHYYSLSRDGTDRVLAGEEPHGSMTEWPGEPPWPNTFSSALVVPRSVWDDVGGFDERFRGWGFEDLAFWSACCALTSRFDRVSGPVFHLWHERDRARREGSPEHADNETLGRRYLAAKSTKEVMLEILREPGGPLA